MDQTEPSQTKPHRRELSWPAAATLITAILGAVATTVASPSEPEEDFATRNARDYVSTREIGEVQARLAAIEIGNQRMRTELRSEIKEVRDLVRQLLKQH